MGIKIKEKKYNDKASLFLYSNEKFGVNYFAGKSAKNLFKELSKNGAYNSYDIYLNSYENQELYLLLNETSYLIFDFDKYQKKYLALFDEIKEKTRESKYSINIIIKFNDDAFEELFFEINSFFIEKGIRSNILFFLTSEYQEKLIQQLVRKEQIFKTSANIREEENISLPLIYKRFEKNKTSAKRNSFISNILISLFLLASIVSAYAVGFNLQSSKIDATFDYIGYTVEKSELQRGVAHVKGIKDDDSIGYTQYLNMHTYIRNNYGGDNNSYIVAGRDNPINFELSFSEVDYSVVSKVIGVSTYSNSKKMEAINLELYKNLYPDHYIKQNTEGTIYLPSSMADKIMNDYNNEYTTYDEIIEKMVVEVKAEENGKSFTALWGVGNIFFDTYVSGFYEGLDKRYGSDLREFLGSYVVATSRTPFSQLGSTLYFDITQSLFSVKDIIKESIHKNIDIDDAYIDFFAKQNGQINNFYSFESVKNVFNSQSLNVIQFLFISLMIITLLAAIFLIVGKLKSEKGEKKAAVEYNIKKLKLKKQFFNEYFFTVLPFVLVHLVALLVINKTSIIVLQSYNVFGSAFSVLVLVALILFIYFKKKKSRNNGEQSHD